MARQLTSRQIKFLASYQLTNNATESAINAGYSVKNADVAGCKLLKHPKILAEIDAWKVKKRQEITKEDYIDTALKVFDGGEFKEEPSRVRGLEIAGKALGYIGANENKTNSTTMNILQINLDANQNQLWETARKLIAE